jgi:hypothetical protein
MGVRDPVGTQQTFCDGAAGKDSRQRHLRATEETTRMLAENELPQNFVFLARTRGSGNQLQRGFPMTPRQTGSKCLQFLEWTNVVHRRGCRNARLSRSDLTGCLAGHKHDPEDYPAKILHSAASN